MISFSKRNDPMSPHYKKLFIASGVFFVLTAFSSVMDIFLDGQDGLSSIHILIEIFTLVLSIAAAMFFLFNSIKITRENQALSQSIVSEVAKKEHYKQKVLKYSDGLSQAIEQEFQKWGLSQTETIIGFLILKGLSSKEMAEIQGSQDKTIRHHCSSIYKKSGLSSRSELSAYFLEDLLVSQDK